ncbi:MAG: cyclic lactone autoinducer peptide [Peptococcaceae bacterium]|nr:MAG: cyclic lactone autoinducer peptide [Peptococcaceae bacterium]
MLLKKLLLGIAANLALLVAILGVQPTSLGNWYQPEVPEELRR